MKFGCWMPCQGTDGYYGSQGPGINRLSARVSRHMAALILRPETANRRPRTCLALLGSAPMWEVAASFLPLFLLFSSSLFPSSSTPGSWPPFLSFYRRQNVRRVARYPLSLRCPCPGTGADDQQPGDDRGECPTYFRGRFWAVGDGLGARTVPLASCCERRDAKLGKERRARNFNRPHPHDNAPPLPLEHSY